MESCRSVFLKKGRKWRLVIRFIRLTRPFMKLSWKVQKLRLRKRALSLRKQQQMLSARENLWKLMLFLSNLMMLHRQPWRLLKQPWKLRKLLYWLPRLILTIRRFARLFLVECRVQNLRKARCCRLIRQLLLRRCSSSIRFMLMWHRLPTTCFAFSVKLRQARLRPILRELLK